MDIELNRDTVGMDLNTIPGSMLSFSWGSVSEVLIHEKQPSVSDRAPSVPRSGHSFPGVVKLKWNQEMVTNKATRALLSQSARLFTQLKKKRSTTVISASEIVKSSRKYRSVIHATSESIVVEDDSSLELFKMVSKIEMVWHLCEILFLDSHPPGILLNQLLSWIRWHLNHRLLILTEQVLKTRRPTDHPSFWKVLYHFMFSGQIDQAKEWINLYKQSISGQSISDQSISRQASVAEEEEEPREEIERANILIQVLNKMPMYSYGQLSHEVDMRWSVWSSEVKEILATGFFMDSPLEVVMRVLSGDEETVRRIATRKENEVTWMHVLVTKILFKDPFLKEHDLQSIASEAVEVFTSAGHEVTSIDRTLLAAFNYDLMQVVTEACSFNDNWWFVSHFVDLLSTGDSLQSHGIESEDKLRDFLLLDFADTLMTHESLWRIAIDYYDWSGHQSSSCEQGRGEEINSTGRYRLELMLERIPLKSESIAYKILDIGMKRSLKSLTRSVCRSMAQQWIRKGNLSSALTWSLRSEDSNISSFIADQMLLKYSQMSTASNSAQIGSQVSQSAQGGLGQSSSEVGRSSSETGRSSSETGQSSCVIDSDILSSLGPSMLVSEKLTFLAKYYELKQLMKRRTESGSEAAHLLVSLISSNISPPFFLLTLLGDAVQLGPPGGGTGNEGGPKEIFSPEDCCTLLATLEHLIDLRNGPLGNKSGPLAEIDHDEFQRREMELRTAVSKCLSRTIVNGF